VESRMDTSILHPVPDPVESPEIPRNRLCQGKVESSAFQQSRKFRF
jgi:hypothetical protein